MTSVDVIIVNYNSTDYLLGCLDSIYTSLGENILATIYVIDNASRGPLGIITRKYPQVVLFRNSVNIGFARAVNYCIGKSSAPYIFLLNPDTVVGEHFFGSLVNFMEKNPGIGICGPRILESNGRVQGSARAFPTPLTAIFGRNSFLTKHLPNNKGSSKNILTNRTDQQTPIAVDWVSGACMLVRRTAIEDVGMLDERFFLYWEDADWCRRMAQKGWQIFYFPCISILHYTGRSSKNEFFNSLLEFHKSAYKLFVKYSRFRGLKIINFLVFSILIVRFYFVLFGNWAAVLKNGKTDPH